MSLPRWCLNRFGGLRFIIIILFMLVLLAISSHALPLQSSSSYNSDKEKRDNIVCGAASWTDIVAFFLLNYVVHAGTIRHFPGDSTTTQIWWTACAFFVPFAGVWRACESIANARPFEKDALERAKYAGALCMVHHLSLRRRGARNGEEILFCRIRGRVPSTPDENGFVACTFRNDRFEFWGSRIVNPLFEKIHGGGSALYSDSFVIVPPNLKVVSKCDGNVVLSCSSGTLKCAAAIVQVGFAAVTLYRARGDQVEKYGYAAFGLTVIPYAIMSVLNLMANILTPEYPTLFTVHSDLMDAAERRPGLVFEGVVGTIVPRSSETNDFYGTLAIRHESSVQIPEGYVDESDEELRVEASDIGRHETIPNYAKTQKIQNIAAIAIGLAALATPYILISVFSDGFKSGDISTPVERGFVMSWLVVGQVFGALVGLFGYGDSTEGNLFLRAYTIWDYLGPALLVVLVITPAVGGFVVVGLMIKQFGSCVIL